MAALTSKLSQHQTTQLRTLLGDVELSLLYQASVHGYTGPAFHQRCDRQGPTVVVAYNNSGYAYGGYTSKDYTQTGQYIDDDKAFLFRLRDPSPLVFRVLTTQGTRARLDDGNTPRFGDDIWFCYNNTAEVNCAPGYAYMFTSYLLYGNDQTLTECEVYKVTEAPAQPAISLEQKPWRNILWTAERRAELMESIKTYKPMNDTVKKIRILPIGPVGAGKSSFFNSINSIFWGHVTSKAMSGSLDTSVTKQYRTYTVRAGPEGKPLPFILCDTMGLEEASEAGMSVGDIISAIKGDIPDRYKFNPAEPYEPESEVKRRPVTLQDKVQCVVYVLDTCKVALMPSKVEEKLTAIRKRVNSMGIPQIVLLTKVDEACPLVGENLQDIYLSSYIKTKVREASSRVGVSMCSVIPVKNYSHELELDVNCDILLLTALQQMLRYADNYLDDLSPEAD
ncbi:interferon-induced protein 44-like [Brachyhypopomus gauderio]|uniref:interferon-induced protein 44-like n=1 Tax=Brachyhypopomus gauderio TaxID=698409 RepID=UPI004042BFE1